MNFILALVLILPPEPPKPIEVVIASDSPVIKAELTGWDKRLQRELAKEQRTELEGYRDRAKKLAKFFKFKFIPLHKSPYPYPCMKLRSNWDRLPELAVTKECSMWLRFFEYIRDVWWHEELIGAWEKDRLERGRRWLRRLKAAKDKFAKKNGLLRHKHNYYYRPGKPNKVVLLANLGFIFNEREGYIKRPIPCPPFKFELWPRFARWEDPYSYNDEECHEE